MPSCVVKACKNYMSKLNKSQGITYHRFPKEKNQRDDWVLIIRNCRGENNWNPSPASTVCSTHFDDIDFMTSAKGRRCLVPHAIPKRQKLPYSMTGLGVSQPPTSSSTTISSLPQVLYTKNLSKIEAAPQPHSVQLRRLNYTLHKKSLRIDMQKKKIKTLNQKIRRFRNRNESLKNILKNLRNLKGRKETIFICMEDGPANNDDDE
ncbi:hypothetical protein ABMA28_012598 [Loxostege sticticalis]|uniref:THAP-type domain-containing protein n=1 Tax=Loxostege sticticalis TaxID=481309 RepID=A0ABD0S4X3_LOXSC